MFTESCSSDKKKILEIQLTQQSYGHFLNSTQTFSPDDKWIVYDTRNDDGGIGVTGSIEMVSIDGKETRVLYKTHNQTKYGPGVGAATFSPVSSQVLFIHGIRNADETKPYAMPRRTGVAIDISKPNEPIFMDARNITPPFTPGALRGGTHAYSWSGDGEWICFTYNDYVIEQLSKNNPEVKDLRTIAVMAPGVVHVPEDSTHENNSGVKFSAVVATVTENPKPGSNEIDKAFDEGWVGKNGYQKADGSWQKRAVAFQGNLRDNDNKTTTQIFITDIPDDITLAQPGKPLEGTATTRTNVPKGCQQRRLTHIEGGITGPRHWLKSLTDGTLIFFLNNDANGITQVFGVSPNGGNVQQITSNDFSVAGPINISPDDQFVSYIADNSVFITNIANGETQRLTPSNTVEKPEGAVIWSNDGKKLTYNRKAKGYYQIYLLPLP